MGYEWNHQQGECKLPFCVELDEAVQQSLNSLTLQPLQEFFKVEDHNFKSKEELVSYINRVKKEDNASNKLFLLLSAFLTGLTVTSSGIGIALGGSLPMLGLTVCLTIIHLIISTICACIGGNASIKQIKIYKKIVKQINNKISSLEDKLYDATDEEQRKELKQAIIELKKCRDKVKREIDAYTAAQNI